MISAVGVRERNLRVALKPMREKLREKAKRDLKAAAAALVSDPQEHAEMPDGMAQGVTTRGVDEEDAIMPESDGLQEAVEVDAVPKGEDPYNFSREQVPGVLI